MSGQDVSKREKERKEKSTGILGAISCTETLVSTLVEKMILE